MKVVKSDEEILGSVSGGDVNKTVRKDVFQIDPKTLTVDAEHNVRNFTDKVVLEHIESLAANIAENGVLTPLTCRRESIGKDPNTGEPIYKYIIVDGECRYRATLLLESRGTPVCRVPAILERSTNNEANRVLDMLNANESLRFAPIELAAAYNKFLNFGWTEEEIAKKLGKSLNHVKETVALLAHDESVIAALKSNKVTANNVRQLDKKIKEEGVMNDYTRKKEVSERLEKAIKLAETEEGGVAKSGKLNITKFLGISQTESERIISAIELITDTLRNRDFTRANLLDLAEDLRAGQSIQNAVNHVFGLSLIEDTEVEVSANDE